MKNAAFILVLLFAVPCSAAVITVTTCRCVTIPNSTSEIGNPDHIEPPDEQQATDRLADLLHEPPFDPDFDRHELERKMRECFDTTTIIPDGGAGSGGRTPIAEPISLMLMTIGVVGVGMRVRR